MYLKNTLHLSHERFIFDSKRINSTLKFVRFRFFKRKDDIEQYYINEREIV